MAFKIEVRDNIQEFEVNGDIFTVSLKDENLKFIQEFFTGWKLDTTNDNYLDELLSDIDVLFIEEDAGRKLYKASGESAMVLTDVLIQIVEKLNELSKVERAARYKKYLNNNA